VTTYHDYDRDWDRIVERLDGVDATDADLAQAEALLAVADPEEQPVSAEWIETIVRQATAPVDVPESDGGTTAPQPARVIPLRWTWLRNVAAVLLAHWLLSATVVIGSLALTLVLVLWPSGQRADLTMSRATAYLLLHATDQSLEDRRTGLREVFAVADYSLDVLRQLRNDPAAAPPELQLLAANWIDYLRALLDAPSVPMPSLLEEQWRQPLLAANDAMLPPEARWFCAWFTAQLAESAILALRSVPPGTGLDSDLRIYLTNLRRELAR
jgi:hypothetical protein